MRTFLKVLAVSCLISTSAIAQGSSNEVTDETVGSPAEEGASATKSSEKTATKAASAKAAAAKSAPAAQKSAASAAPIVKNDTDYVMLRIGSQDVAASDVKHMWEGLFPAGSAPDFDGVKPDMRDKVLRGIMAERLLWQEALKQGVDKSDVVQRELDEIKRKLVVKHFLEAKTTDISDKELRAEYDNEVLAVKDQKEIRARHVLVGSEKEAIDVKKQIEGGKGFDEVARDYSKDPGSAKQGGDLGYFTKDKMVKEFAEAAFDLKKGEISSPVKTSFGWHIIKVEDIRPVTVPTFNDAKEVLRNKLEEKHLSDYIRTLVKQADVKLYDAKGKEMAFNKDVGDASDSKK